MAQPTSSALRALALEYKSLQEEPVEGFRVKLVNEDNMFEWEVAIFGPPDTLYQGGYFKVPSCCLRSLFVFHILYVVRACGFITRRRGIDDVYPNYARRRSWLCRPAVSSRFSLLRNGISMCIKRARRFQRRVSKNYIGRCTYFARERERKREGERNGTLFIAKST